MCKVSFMKKRKQARIHRKPKAAATKDVVGKVPHSERINPKWQRHYRHLVELRDRLLHTQGDLAKDAIEEQPSYSIHMADAGTDNYDRDFALGMLSSEQDAVYEIDEALDRIRNGAYGICELTGKRIEPKRLAAIPWTRFSAAAEKQFERQGKLKHARLGPRDTVPRIQAAEPEEKP